MKHPARRHGRALTSLLALIVMGAVVGTMPAASAEDPAPADAISIAPAGPLLDEPQRGQKAIRQLGDQLPVAASRSDLRPAELRTLLSTDKTVWVDTEGRVFYKDPIPDSTPAPQDSAVPAPAEPPSDTFALHSNPGARLTILLDFDGAPVSGTAWNAQSNVTPGDQPAWDPAGDGPTFNNLERAKIQQVWAMVAEDYAPFEVDVTTADPGVDGLLRSSSDDSVYGSRVLITPSDDPHEKLCGRGCGGIAYLSVFDRVGSYNQPAWVFPQALGDDAKAVAEAATHEAGHNLGLEHDATSVQDYYPGQGVWAPIMGVGYDRPLVQWSRGSYPGANNQQDDLRILTGYLGARTDEASASPSTPSVLPRGAATIGTPEDVDSYILGSCTEGAVVQVLPAAVAPDLDVRAILYDAQGTQRSVVQPPSGVGDGATASGLGATVTVPAQGDDWVLSIEGVGEGAWNTSGYDDYGSLGAYSVSAPGCNGQHVTGAPSAPNNVTTSVPGPGSLTLSWTPPSVAGDEVVGGYIVSRSGSPSTQVLGSDARSHTFSGLTAGTSYQLSVRALNATGAGPSATVSVTTQAPPAAAPGTPRAVTGVYDQVSSKLQAWWTEPLDGGSQPITGYAIYLDGSYLGQLAASSRSVEITNPGGFTEGQHVVGIAAVNAVGSSPPATTTITVALPVRPANDDLSNARVLAGSSGSVSGDNTYATGNASDPSPPSAYPAGGYSVWYSWTPTFDGPVTMQTSGGGADRDTTLAAYTGQPGGLVEVAGSDDANGFHAAVGFQAVAGTRYLVAVDGFGSVGGTGPFVLSWSQRQVSAPKPPAGVSARPGDKSAVVSWTAPAANGSAITGYTVIARTGGEATRATTVAPENTATTLTGLTNGTTYDVTVTATNALGTSAESAAATVTPATVPNRPTAPTATRGDKSAIVSWTKPSGNGTPVTGYTLTTTPGGTTKTITDPDTTMTTITGLTNGTDYTVTVTATNTIGDSPASAPSNTVTPAGVTVSFEAVTRTVQENAGVVYVAVTREGNTDLPSSIAYASTGGSAVSGKDFALTPGIIEFGAGETRKQFALTVLNDTTVEGPETIDLTLSPASDPDHLEAISTARVTVEASDQKPDELISTATTSGFIGNNIYNTTASGQAKVLSARRLTAKNFYVRVYNDGNVTNTIALKGSAATSGSSVTYYSGTTDVTTKMRTATGWRVSVRPGAYTLVRVRLLAARSAAISSRKTATVSALWTGDGARADTVKASLSVIR